METYARYAILDGKERFKPIEFGIWEPHPEKKGFVMHKGNISIEEVFNQLKDRLKKDDLLPDEYFDITIHASYEKASPFPYDYYWIACYPVRGSSEGYYIHVEVVVDIEVPGLTEKIRGNRLLFLGKTFQGQEFAAQVAAACAKHLGA